MNGASWQARTAVALLIGAIGEGACVLLAEYVAGGFVLATFVDRRSRSAGASGPSIGGFGAGFPPLGIAFVDSGEAYLGERILTALAVVHAAGRLGLVHGTRARALREAPMGALRGRPRSRLEASRAPYARRIPLCSKSVPLCARRANAAS